MTIKCGNDVTSFKLLFFSKNRKPRAKRPHSLLKTYLFVKADEDKGQISYILLPV
jgi:hypothetical protein